MKFFKNFIKVTLIELRLNKIIGIFLISMLPIIELRGAIPIGAAIGLPWYLEYDCFDYWKYASVPFILFI